jgi:hypothetical protein
MTVSDRFFHSEQRRSDLGDGCVLPLAAGPDASYGILAPEKWTPDYEDLASACSGVI